MRSTTPKTLPLVWLRLTQHVAEALEHPEAAKALCADVDALLDDWAAQDAFGTEGQNDPRGDQRDRE